MTYLCVDWGIDNTTHMRTIAILMLEFFHNLNLFSAKYYLKFDEFFLCFCSFILYQTTYGWNYKISSVFIHSVCCCFMLLLFWFLYSLQIFFFVLFSCCTATNSVHRLLTNNNRYIVALVQDVPISTINFIITIIISIFHFIVGTNISYNIKLVKAHLSHRIWMQ